MASSQDIRAGREFVELFVDRNPLVRGLHLASKDIARWGASISSVGKTVMAAGSAILAPILAATKVFADITWLGGVLQGLVADAQEAWTGIANALGAGDIALAAKVLWLALKMEWTKGVAAHAAHV